jgi:hypothetical protein
VVADHPEQRRIVRQVHGDRAAIQREMGHGESFSY